MISKYKNIVLFGTFNVVKAADTTISKVVILRNIDDSNKKTEIQVKSDAKNFNSGKITDTIGFFNNLGSLKDTDGNALSTKIGGDNAVYGISEDGSDEITNINGNFELLSDKKYVIYISKIHEINSDSVAITIDTDTYSNKDLININSFDLFSLAQKEENQITEKEIIDILKRSELVKRGTTNVNLPNFNSDDYYIESYNSNTSKVDLSKKFENAKAIIEYILTSSTIDFVLKKSNPHQIELRYPNLLKDSSFTNPGTAEKLKDFISQLNTPRNNEKINTYEDLLNKIKTFDTGKITKLFLLAPGSKWVEINDFNKTTQILPTTQYKIKLDNSLFSGEKNETIHITIVPKDNFKLKGISETQFDICLKEFLSTIDGVISEISKKIPNLITKAEDISIFIKSDTGDFVNKNLVDDNDEQLSGGYNVKIVVNNENFLEKIEKPKVNNGNQNTSKDGENENLKNKNGEENKKNKCCQC